MDKELEAYYDKPWFGIESDKQLLRELQRTTTSTKEEFERLYLGTWVVEEDDYKDVASEPLNNAFSKEMELISTMTPDEIDEALNRS